MKAHDEVAQAAGEVQVRMEDLVLQKEGLYRVAQIQLLAGRWADWGDGAAGGGDGRPFPAWPGRSDVWGDTANWEVGHWLNGRLGNAGLGDLIRSICARSGIDPNALDVSRLADAVPGFVIAILPLLKFAIWPDWPPVLGTSPRRYWLAAGSYILLRRATKRGASTCGCESCSVPHYLTLLCR